MATIYKQGSRGEEVRKIQQMLIKAGCGAGMAADGIYGPKTANAVKAFQQKAGLKPVDGIVGPATLTRLTAWTQAAKADNDELHIIRNPIQTHITFSIGRPIRYIAVHYTAGSNSRKGAALGTRNVFLSRPASADYVVDDEQIVQINPDPRNYYCWAVGDKRNPYGGGATLYGKATNKNTISIEICSNLKATTTAAVPNHEGWYFTDKALALALRLVRHLMREYGVPKENVVRHYDVSGKLCPGVCGWNDAVLYTTDGKQTTAKNDSNKWQEFWNAI